MYIYCKIDTPAPRFSPKRTRQRTRPDEGPLESLLVGSLVQGECRVRSAHLEGSHCIYIGEVLHTFVRADAEPLLYFDGAYRRLAPKA